MKIFFHQQKNTQADELQAKILSNLLVSNMRKLKKNEMYQ